MPTWNYSATAAAYSRTCMTPPTGAQGHAALPRIAPKMEEWCVHGESHSSPQMSLIQEGFVLRKDLSPQRFHLASVAKCSCPQHHKLQGLQSLMKAATRSNSLARENSKDKEPRGTYPASSCTHFLQDSCFPCMERQEKRARMYHVMASR